MTTTELGYWVLALGVALCVFHIVSKRRAVVRARKAERALALAAAIRRHPAGNLR